MDKLERKNKGWKIVNQRERKEKQTQEKAAVTSDTWRGTTKVKCILLHQNHHYFHYYTIPSYNSYYFIVFHMFV